MSGGAARRERSVVESRSTDGRRGEGAEAPAAAIASIFSSTVGVIHGSAAFPGMLCQPSAWFRMPAREATNATVSSICRRYGSPANFIGRLCAEKR